MNRLVPFVIILSIVFISCGESKKNEDTTTAATELSQLLEDLSKNGDGKNQPDTAAAAKILSLVDDITLKWKEIKSEEGNFRIEFPDFEIQEGKSRQLLDGKEKTLHYYSINTQHLDHVNLGYRGDYSFWPDIKTKAQIDEQFNIQRDYVLSAANARLDYEIIIDTLEYPGRELHFTIDDSKIRTRYRMFFHNGIFYKIAVITEEGKLFNNSLTRFLDSFKTLDGLK